MILALGRMAAVLALTLQEVVVLAWAQVRGRKNSQHALQRAHRWGLLLSSLLGIKIDVSGTFPEDPAILVANHRSYTDILALLALKPFFFLAKREVASWPLIGSAVRNSQTIFVRRTSRKSRHRAKDEIRRRIQSGQSVGVFCEGTTHAGPGMFSFLPGVFYLAAQNHLAVVPIAVQYASAEDAWVDSDSLARHFFSRFGRPTMRVSIAVGPTLRGSDGAALKEAAENWIAEQLERLSTIERRLPCRELPATGMSLSAARPAA